MALDLSHSRSCSRPRSRGAGLAPRLLACCAAGLLAAGCSQLLGIEELDRAVDAGVEPEIDGAPPGPTDTTPPSITNIAPGPTARAWRPTP